MLLIVLAISYHLDVTKHGIAITPRFHFGVCEGGVWLFSDKWPYTGSTTYVGDSNRSPAHFVWRGWRLPGTDYGLGRSAIVNERGDVLQRKTGGDLPGVYYRHFWWYDLPQTLWTLEVSLWYPILAFAVLPAAGLLRRARADRLGSF